MFGLPFDPAMLNNLQGFGNENNKDFLSGFDQSQVEKLMGSMGIGLDSFSNNEMTSNYGINKVANHFMAMARSGVLKQEEIHNFQCEPFETDSEYGFKLVWRK